MNKLLIGIILGLVSYIVWMETHKIPYLPNDTVRRWINQEFDSGAKEVTIVIKNPNVR